MTLLPIPVEQANVAIFGVESGVFPLTAMDGAHHQAMRADPGFLPAQEHPQAGKRHCRACHRLCGAHGAG
jgi:hypothetical protein